MSEKTEFRGLKGLKKQRRIQVIALAAVALLGATGLVGYAMRDGINFFRSPTQVMEDPPRAGETFRIGGLVVEGSIQRGDGTEVAFAVTDTNATVPVRYTGILPDLFREGKGVVAQGQLGADGRFAAKEVLAKHDENYMPPEAQHAMDQAKAQQSIKTLK